MVYNKIIRISKDICFKSSLLPDMNFGLCCLIKSAKMEEFK